MNMSEFQQTQQNNEISLLDIVKTLFRNWWILLIAFIVGASIGGSIGFKKNHNKTYYGTTIMFYVNPVKEGSSGLPVYGSYGENVTETMAVLLESEYFAQEILNGIDGVPEKEIDGKPNSAYFKYLKDVQTCTTFTNKQSGIEEGVVQPNNIFYASISVLNNPAFAQVLRDRIQDEAISFIEENMPVPSGYNTTKCSVISVNHEIIQLNSNNVLSDAIKYAVVFGSASLVVGCIVALCVDRFKPKRTYQ